MRRANLQVLTGAHATRVLFEGKRATGVEFLRRGKRVTARAGREVILCAGAINSPQLLQVSGIGPAALLMANGIHVVSQCEAVGQNFQDHLCYDRVYRANRPTLNDALHHWSGKLRAGLAFLFGRKGPLALNVNHAGGFFRSAPGLDRPDMQLYFSPLSFERLEPGTLRMTTVDPFSGFCICVSPCRPISRGHVALRSADPLEAPLIQPNSLAVSEDLEAFIRGPASWAGLRRSLPLQRRLPKRFGPVPRRTVMKRWPKTSGSAAIRCTTPAAPAGWEPNLVMRLLTRSFGSMASMGCGSSTPRSFPPFLPATSMPPQSWSAPKGPLWCWRM